MNTDGRGKTNEGGGREEGRPGIRIIIVSVFREIYEKYRAYFSHFVQMRLLPHDADNVVN